MITIAAHTDFTRRTAAMQKLWQLVDHPGLMLSVPECEGSPVFFLLDLTIGNNAFAWMLLRRSVRRIGSEFFARCLSYIGILFLWAFFAVLILNGILLAHSRHNVASLGVIAGGLSSVSAVVIISMRQADLLQATVCNHRLLLKRAVSQIDQRLVEAYSSQGGSARSGKQLIARLLASHNFLNSANEEIGYDEEILNSIEIFGVPIGMPVVWASFGLISSGLIYAWQQESQMIANGEYTNAGWYLP